MEYVYHIVTEAMAVMFLQVNMRHGLLTCYSFKINGERERESSKTLILKDSSVRSIWT